MTTTSLQASRVSDVQLTRPAPVVKKAADTAYKAAKVDSSENAEPPVELRQNTPVAPKPGSNVQQQQGIETYAKLIKKTQAERVKTRFDLLL